MDQMTSVPGAVLAEFSTLTDMSIFFYADLEKEWLGRVFMTDASEEGFGVVTRTAEIDQIRHEANRGNTLHWHARRSPESGSWGGIRSRRRSIAVGSETGPSILTAQVPHVPCPRQWIARATRV